VQWKEHTIFAGEDVECVITFKNVLETPGAEVTSAQRPAHQRRASRSIPSSIHPDSYFSFKSPPNPVLHNRPRSTTQSPVQKTFDRPHRASMSLTSPVAAAHSFPPTTHSPRVSHGQSANHTHKRSLSILSIEGDAANEKTPVPPQFHRSRQGWGHNRAASLQALPQKPAAPEELLYSPGSTSL
jgi:RAB6A-GEF complex partner protein 2